MKLFQPGKIGTLVIKNRIVMASIGTRFIELDGGPSQRAIDYLAARAKGGVGLITTGALRVETKLENVMENGWAAVPMLTCGMHVRKYNEMVEAVHDYGAKLAVQLAAAAGRVATRFGGKQPIAPSVLPCFWDPRVKTRAMTIEEIEELVKAFGTAASLAKAAGVDAIELNAHEGYLFDQFKTPLWNKRTDKYGGDLEGRLRFSLEVVQEIKAKAGRDFPVIYKYAADHYLAGGRQVEESLEIARRLEKAGVDALHVDAGCYDTWYWPHPPIYQPPGCMVDMAEAVKKVVSIPVIATGKLGYPELAERVLAEGKADFVALGRPLLADPEWPLKVRQERSDDIRPCIGCHECLTRHLFQGKYLSCAVNPEVGKEREFALQPADRPKSVLVIGGGPGGMEAAIVAAQRGHQVSLWEKSDQLGGNLIAASIPEFKQDLRMLTSYLSTQVRKLNVRIEFGKEATLETVQEAKPDVVIVATGATPLIPRVPGIDRSEVLTATDVLRAGERAGQAVLVAGGGLIGCETAVYLAQRGKRVTLVEALGDLCPTENPANRQQLLRMITESKVNVLTRTSFLGMTDEGALIGSNGDRRTLPVDTVVLALGLRAESGLQRDLEGKVPEVHSIGDCVAPRRIYSAIHEAFRIVSLI